MTTWVMLRGLGRESGHWGEFRALFETAVGARVVCIDFPGNGSVHEMASLGGVKEMAAYCRAVLSSREIGPPYLVFALSLGGMVAVEWMRGFPDDIAGCVLVNTSMRGLSAFHQRLRPGAAWALLRMAAQPDSCEREGAIYDLTSNRGGGRSRHVAEWREIAARHPVRRMNVLRQLLAAGRYRLALDGPPCPVLVLCSARDRLVDPACSQRLAARWGAELAVHASAGHDLPLDDGSWTARRVAEWAGRHFHSRYGTGAGATGSPAAPTDRAIGGPFSA